VQYVFLGFLQGGGAGGTGLLNNTRQYVWLRVTQYTSKMMRVKLFAHLHSYVPTPLPPNRMMADNIRHHVMRFQCSILFLRSRLSLQWHLSRKTGEVLRIMDRGTDSVTSVLSTVVFSIAPTIVCIWRSKAGTSFLTPPARLSANVAWSTMRARCPAG
jgi:ATP-binding cassette subfamily B (MDR/TAP) protein 6